MRVPGFPVVTRMRDDLGVAAVEVYADIWCPFTHLGLRRLVARREEEERSLPIRVRAWPLELVNGEPLDAAFVAEEITELRAQVAPDVFEGFREDRFPSTTLPALALVESAYKVSPVVGESMSLMLRDLLFEHGGDVSDPAVLAAAASDLGVPLAGPAEAVAVQDSWDAGRERGVVGSPHFFTASAGYFCPALDIEKVDGRFRIRLDEPAFEEFVASCFGSVGGDDDGGG